MVCQVYDYQNNPKKLEFHHVDSGNKSFTISANYNRNWEEMVEEIRKCVILCKNCHIKHHMALRKL